MQHSQLKMSTKYCIWFVVYLKPTYPLQKLFITEFGKLIAYGNLAETILYSTCFGLLMLHI
jgi:hypothetical protein